jgi:hypothetical protein
LISPQRASEVHSEKLHGRFAHLSRHLHRGSRSHARTSAQHAAFAQVTQGTSRGLGEQESSRGGGAYQPPTGADGRALHPVASIIAHAASAIIEATMCPLMAAPSRAMRSAR